LVLRTKDPNFFEFVYYLKTHGVLLDLVIFYFLRFEGELGFRFLGLREYLCRFHCSSKK
jgi:hypothetical protein